MKIEIGPGHDPIPGYDYYVDAIATPRITHVLDFSRDGLNPFISNTIDEILAIHFLEHLGRDKQDFFFKECFRVLRSGGKLEVHVPNLLSTFKIYQYLENNKKIDLMLDSLQVMLFGAGEGHFDKHRVAYSYSTLSHVFGKNGFISVQDYTGIRRDRHTEGWDWAVKMLRNSGQECPDFSLIVEGKKP